MNSIQLKSRAKINLSIDVLGKREDGYLADLIDKADRLTQNEIEKYGDKAKKRVKEAYTWEHICALYEHVFLKETFNE